MPGIVCPSRSAWATSGIPSSTWLTDEQRVLLAAGGMRLPQFINYNHDAVLVGVPDVNSYTDVARP